MSFKKDSAKERVGGTGKKVQRNASSIPVYTHNINVNRIG
jgi:hypothetical protein